MMKQIRRVALILALLLCLMPAFGLPALATNSIPSLTDVINGEQKAATTETGNPSVETSPSQDNQSDSSGTFDGSLPDPGVGLTIDELRGFYNYDDNKDVTDPFRSLLGKVMGTVFPVLVGIICGCLILRMLLDLLYIVAPFLRGKLAPGAAGAEMGVVQQGGGQMGMQGGMMGGQMGGYGNQMGGYGNQMGGYGGRGRGGYGNAQGQQGQQMQQIGTQWVSQAAINAVMMGQQVGPNGKPQNEFIIYAKSMIVPLILVPIMLILITSGALTNVGFYLGDILNNAIQSKVG